jgi:hypothetical protein
VGMTTATDAQARELFIVDAHHDDGRRFVVRSDELLTAFLDLTNHWSEPLAALLRRSDSMKNFSMLATLAPASGRSVPSR